MTQLPPIAGNPFEEARSSCRHAETVARDITIDDAGLRALANRLDADTVAQVMANGMGENCDTVPEEFNDARDAVNFAVLFSLLQFGHGFRHELHSHCGRGASKTITLGTRNLRSTGELNSARLQALDLDDIRRMFGLPDNDDLGLFAVQLRDVAREAGDVLDGLGKADFHAFCLDALQSQDTEHHPAATLVRSFARHFPAFDDQAQLQDGSRVVLVKKATLAVGEIRRLAGSFDPAFTLAGDFHKAIAPVDNVIPAMLVYHGALRLSPSLQTQIESGTLERGHRETELRAVALAACERIVNTADRQFSALDLGYYLWRSGKDPGARQFPRHHTKDTVFY